MNAKDYLSGVYLDTQMFTKAEVTKLMEDYANYTVEYSKQQSAVIGNKVELPNECIMGAVYRNVCPNRHLVDKGCKLCEIYKPSFT